MSALEFDLTKSEQWAAHQVRATCTRAGAAIRQAHASMQTATQAGQIAETQRAEFVEALLEAHEETDPGTRPRLEDTDDGIRIVWDEPKGEGAE